MMKIVYAAKKDDPVKEGAKDGMEEFIEGDEKFEYPPFDPDKPIEKYYEEIEKL